MHIRPIAEKDREAWTPLWAGYTAYHDVTLPDAVTDSVWSRLMEADVPLNGLAVDNDEGQMYGFAHYVVHQNTWNPGCICYLEDMYVAENMRGGGAGRAIIRHLGGLAKENGWGRLYWHALKDNKQARRLYDSVADLSDYVRYDYRF